MQWPAHHGDGATLFKGKHFLVTGVASGIGEKTARMLLDAGARVTGMDLREPAIGCERFVMLDQGDAASVDAAVQALDGGFDGLCNVAGVPPGDRFTPAQILKINFYGLRRLTLGVEPSLNDGAAVVSVASAAGMGWMSNLERNRTFLLPGMSTEATRVPRRPDDGGDAPPPELAEAHRSPFTAEDYGWEFRQRWEQGNRSPVPAPY